MTNQDWLVEVAAGAVGWVADYMGFPQAVGDEVDNALLGVEGPRHGEGKVAVLARTREGASAVPINFA